MQYHNIISLIFSILLIASCGEENCSRDGSTKFIIGGIASGINGAVVLQNNERE